jgi:hypothetical protein
VLPLELQAFPTRQENTGCHIGIDRNIDLALILEAVDIGSNHLQGAGQTTLKRGLCRVLAVCCSARHLRM